METQEDLLARKLSDPVLASSDREDCGGEGPDVGCDGVCDSGLANDDCGVCDGDNSSCTGCLDSGATNYDVDATIQGYNEYSTSICTYASCDDIPTGTGCLFDDGTSATWNDGWWNCGEWGGQVCGLAEVTFEVTIPDYLGVPHVQGTYNDWCGSCYNDMADGDADGVWQHTQYFNPGDFIEYKIALGDWSNQETVPGECGTGGEFSNRTFVAGDANSSVTLSNCWGDCGACEFDCADAWNRDSQLDECGVCDGGGIPEGDCSCYGDVLDECGTCDSDPSNDCVQDCEGTWGGDVMIDDCGICGGDSSSYNSF